MEQWQGWNVWLELRRLRRMGRRQALASCAEDHRSGQRKSAWIWTSDAGQCVSVRELRVELLRHGQQVPRRAALQRQSTLGRTRAEMVRERTALSRNRCDRWIGESGFAKATS